MPAEVTETRLAVVGPVVEDIHDIHLCRLDDA